MNFGLAHLAVPESGLVAAVEKELELLSLGGPNAIAECKKLIREVPELDITEGFKRTTSWSVEMFESSEAEEGMGAFREKRSPLGAMSVVQFAQSRVPNTNVPI